MADIAVVDKVMMPVVAPSNTVGAPSKYETHVLPRIAEIEQWVKDGYTDYSIADNLGIGQNTLIEYKKNNSEIIEAYQRARTHRNALVMNKMYLKASGEKITLNKQKLDKFGDVHDLIEEAYIPPDVNAADLFLRNNDPEYKQAKQVETGQNITVNFQLPEAKAKVEQLLTERQKARAIDITGFEVVEAE